MFNLYFSKKQKKLDRFDTCPLCRSGNISAAILMRETLCCDSCSHLFTSERDRQILKSIDLQTPIFWRWNGKQWQEIRYQNQSKSIYSGLFC